MSDLCDVKFCGEYAYYEGWFSSKDPLTGEKTGLVRKVRVCKEHGPLLNGWDPKKAEALENVGMDPYPDKELFEL